MTFNTPYNVSCVGAKYRDSNVKRILNEVKNGTAEVGIGEKGLPNRNEGDNGRHWINDPNYYAKTQHNSTYDVDKDGMRDEWERANGLTVGSKDHNGDKDGDGYTNIEEFTNSEARCN